MLGSWVNQMRGNQTISAVRSLVAGQPYETEFVYPSLACVLAASRISLGRDPAVEFKGNSQIYAEHSGLRHALAGDYGQMVRPRTSTEGRTWSHLTTLYQHAEIESCNQTINDLLFAQLADMPSLVLDQTARVVGELHDNVASHASGRGFSAAQFYRGKRPCLEIAIVDGGKGFLSNVSRVMPNIMTHGAAIEWCLKKGNTAWKPRKHREVDFGAWADPYAEADDRDGQRDHHMGWGLWLLTELVRVSHGTLWLWTGDAAYSLNSNGTSGCIQTPVSWAGVAIEITLYPDQAGRVDLNPLSDRLEILAEELGL